MTIAIYRRVSGKQDTAAQARELDAYRQRLEAEGHTVREYADEFTGKTLSRTGWEKLWTDVLIGTVDRIVVWRLDRLGRTVAGLSKLLEELLDRKVSLQSLRDRFDLGTAGRNGWPACWPLWLLTRRRFVMSNGWPGWRLPRKPVNLADVERSARGLS
jgi:DNA invertase Pin-like site-specific DNA recombinase